jgi:ribosomal protein S18 acetylase RimI-like enzyme
MLRVMRENPRFPDAAISPGPIQPLENQHKAEALNFLSVRPLHTFVMTGWIQDNGVASPLNRGTFYGYRDQEGRLEGVALIGHVTLFETDSDSALAAFAWLTQNCPSANAVMGEAGKVSRFLNYYMDGRSRPRLICRESLFERRSQEESDEEIPSLCLATPNEMEFVVRVHAQMALEETGVNPLEVDPTGFRQRCARRIRQKRVWVCVEDGRLTFKADVITDLREITYLEGVYVSPERRGNRFGARCVRQLTNTLLKRTKSVCLLVREKNAAAEACYRKAGFTVRDYYETLFLQTK